MDPFKYIKPTKTFMGRLTHGADLLDELTEICIEKNIRLGRVEAIGSVMKARIGYYNQQSKKYRYIEYDEPLEIACLIGNISVREDRPSVHAHVTLSDNKGRAFGGHLASGNIVYACEALILAFDGPDFVRTFDNETELQLWDMSE